MSKIDELLMNEEVEYKKLGEVCEVSKGKQFNKRDMIDNGIYPVINGGISHSGYVNIFNFNENTITISQGGASAGFVNFIKTKFWLGAHAFSVIPKNNIIDSYDYNYNFFNRFLFHMLKMNQINLKDSKEGAGIPSVSIEKILKIKIPIPSIETQEKIVKILDTFTNYLTELQAELQNRTKQYEYYRDLLLSYEYLNKLSEQIFELEKHNEIFFSKISELCLRQKGIDITAKKMKEFDKQGAPVKIFAGGNTVANVEVEFIGINNVINKPSVIVKSRGNIDFEYYDKQFSHKNEMWSYSSLNDKKLNIKFLFYLLKNDLKYFRDNAITGKLPQISTRITDDYKIPVPDIIVQNKVVEILDKFQLLLSDTKGLLPQEIEQRQKQYEYYREKLLTFDVECGSKQASKQVLISRAYFNLLKEAANVVGVNLYGVLNKNLGEICEILDSKRKPITKSQRIAGEYPYYGANGIQDYVKGYIFDGTYILMGEDGSVINKDGTPVLHWVNNKKIWVNNHAHILGVSNIKTCNLRYIYYYLSNYNVSEIVKGVPPKINQENMKKIKILVPPIQVQEYVVSVLDKFETLINDISIGLPREIEQRQKKYEYYREKLLTFDV